MAWTSRACPCLSKMCYINIVGMTTHSYLEHELYFTARGVKPLVCRKMEKKHSLLRAQVFRLRRITRFELHDETPPAIHNAPKIFGFQRAHKNGDMYLLRVPIFIVLWAQQAAPLRYCSVTVCRGVLPYAPTTDTCIIIGADPCVYPHKSPEGAAAYSPGCNPGDECNIYYSAL